MAEHTDELPAAEYINVRKSYVDKLDAENTRLQSTNKGLLDALEGLLKHYDPERAVIDVEPESYCLECTAGTTPNHLNKGPCEYHKALTAIARAKDNT